MSGSEGRKKIIHYNQIFKHYVFKVQAGIEQKINLKTATTSITITG